MANKDKKKNPPVEAPINKKKEETQETKVTTPVKVVQPTTPAAMTQHDKVLYTSVIQHRKDELKESGGSAEQYQGLTAIEDALIIDVAVTEMVLKKNAGAFIMNGNEKVYNEIRLLAAEMGVTLKPFKSLPKPTKEQLAAVGLVGVSNEGKVVLQLEDKDVSKETKEAVKAEEKANEEAKKDDKKYLTDHTLIQNEEQLKEALGFQLVNRKIVSPVDRLITAAQFYRAYLEARAEKSDNAEAELAKIHEFTLADLLQDISTMVPPTYTASGFGKYLVKCATNAKSVVPAFNWFKRACKNRKTGQYRYTDEEIAAFVRVLIVWANSAQIASIGKDLKSLSKDANKNAKAIDECNKKIAACQEAIALTTEPDFELADNFLAAYNTDDHPLHESAKLVARSILDTYYADVDIPEIEFDSALLNIQQRVGIILNLFNSPIGQRDEYSEENLFDMSSPEEKKPEEKPAEEEAKNA